MDRFRLSSLLKSSDLTPRTQRHLSRVYQTLFACTVTAATTSYLQVQGYVGDAWVPWSFLGSLLCMLAVKLTTSEEEVNAHGSGSSSSSSSSVLVQSHNNRTAFLLGFSAFQGISLGPMLSLAAYLNPYLIVNAFVSTSLMFLCFSASALLTRRRSYLFLGGLLSSMLSVSFWFSLFYRLFGFGAGMYPGELALGLIIFSGYILYDTQVMVERADAGSLDVPGHALDLFVDAAGLFVRLLYMLMSKDNNNTRRRRRNQDEDQD